MHTFDQLIYRGTQFNLNALNNVQSTSLADLEIAGRTSSVTNLQMVNFQKAVIAVGLFSMFESTLQMGLACENGFKEAKRILLKAGETILNERFQTFCDAINVLKHGKGPSYNALVKKRPLLPFRIKVPGENFFFEGDVSEVATLIEVNDQFVLDCAELVESVSKVIRKERPDYSA